MPGQWNNFLITATEAAGALTGLVIVAISVNIGMVLNYPELHPAGRSHDWDFYSGVSLLGRGVQVFRPQEFATVTGV